MITKAIKKTPKVYKNKKINNGNFANYNLNDYQVFLHLVSKLGKTDEHGEYLQHEKLERAHELTALEFAGLFSLDAKTAYRVIKNSIKKLMATTLTLHDIDSVSGKPKIIQINVCEKAEYIEHEGKIHVLFTGSIMPYLAQQVKQQFVLYNLKEIAGFRSFFTTRLYELIQEFKDTGVLIKSIEQLKEVFATGAKYKMYKDFKIYTFSHACDEINEKTDYGISFTEIKTGRKVTAIQFEFKKTVVEKRFKPDGSQLNTYIKPKHNSDKIETVKTIEAPKKPAPAIMQKITPTLKQKPSDLAVKTIEDLKTKFRVK